MILASTEYRNQSGRWVILQILVLVVGTAWIYVSRITLSDTTNGGPPPSPKEGFSAPEFTLPTLDGEQISLTDLDGKVVMINFWASWCGPCRTEMPTIETVYQQFKNDDFVVLAVNTAYQDSIADVTNFVDEHRVTYPILLDHTGLMSQRYRINGLPTTYFVDQRGVIQSVVVGGPMREVLMRSKIEQMLQVMP